MKINDKSNQLEPFASKHFSSDPDRQVNRVENRLKNFQVSYLVQKNLEGVYMDSLKIFTSVLIRDDFVVSLLYVGRKNLYKAVYTYSSGKEFSIVFNSDCRYISDSSISDFETDWLDKYFPKGI